MGLENIENNRKDGDRRAGVGWQVFACSEE